MTEKHDDQAGFSDTALQQVLAHIDPRSPEEIESDTLWITQVTQQIIERRKQRENIRREQSERADTPSDL